MNPRHASFPARLAKRLHGLAAFCYYRATEPSPRSEQPVVRFDIQDFCYSRYSYAFFRFFALEGYRVVLRPRWLTIHALRRAQYANLLLPERAVTFRRPHSEASLLSDRGPGKRLEPYDLIPSDEPGVYDVPMAQHPLMYSRGLWNHPASFFGPRNRCVLFLGNSDPAVYAGRSNDALFGVTDRVTLWDHLKVSPFFTALGPRGDLEALNHRGVLMVDSRVTPVPFERFRPVLSRYAFFLCSPGAVMPLCHNLIEALSVGTIPVIQRGYAELLRPALEHHHNAIVFDSLEDLMVQIETALALPEERIREMSARALAYYQAHLTPAAVVKRLLSSETHRVRLLAGPSVQLRRERFRPAPPRPTAAAAF